MSFVDDIPAEYLWCRDMRHHAWDPDSLVSREVFNRRLEQWEVWRTVRCFNCPMGKTQKLTKNYQNLRTVYDAPPDYRVAGSPGYRITADDKARIRARSTALRGGTRKASAADRLLARTAQPKKPQTGRKGA